jgi:ParB family chromosome partitioning protein
VTTESLIRAFQRETERQRTLVKRASLARSRLLFVANAMRRLLADEHFVALLRAERLGTLPRPLAERVGPEALP